MINAWIYVSAYEDKLKSLGPTANPPSEEFHSITHDGSTDNAAPATTSPAVVTPPPSESLSGKSPGSRRPRANKSNSFSGINAQMVDDDIDGEEGYEFNIRNSVQIKPGSLPEMISRIEGKRLHAQLAVRALIPLYQGRGSCSKPKQVHNYCQWWMIVYWMIKLRLRHLSLN